MLCKNKSYHLLILLTVLLEGCCSWHSFCCNQTISDKSDRPKEPRVIFLFTEYDFGQIEIGATSTCSFKFFNDGERELVINNIHASCGCTVVKPQMTILKPGQSSEIIATYSADSLGKSRRRIHVATNDPINPQVELWVSAEVVRSQKIRETHKDAPLSAPPTTHSPRETLSPELKKYLRQLNKATNG